MRGWHPYPLVVGQSAVRLRSVLWIALSFVSATAFGATVRSEIGARVNQFLLNGRDVHVTETGLLLDGGSREVILTDAAGNSATVVLLNKSRARRMGLTLAAATGPREIRIDFAVGDAEASLRSALIAALKRSRVTNANTRILLHALTSWFPTYGDEIRWANASGAAPVDLWEELSAGGKLPLVLVVSVTGIGYIVFRRKLAAVLKARTASGNVSNKT